MALPRSLREALRQYPRVRIADIPTPLEKLERLSERVGSLNVFVKRDDQTGLAFGGNKARKLEFLMADVLRQGANCIVTWAGVQSNWCRQVAAAASKLGLDVVLALFTKGPISPDMADGNLLLDRLFDADIMMFDARDIVNMLEFHSVRHIVEPIADDMKRAGRLPYVAPIGGSMTEGSMRDPWGTLGYVEAVAEILEQTEKMGVVIDAVVLATGSAGTQAGLLAGMKLLSPATKVIGVSVYADQVTASGYVHSLANETLAFLGAPVRVGAADVIVFDDYVGEGYGVFTAAVGEAIRLAAQAEGLLLDPVYTGKSMSGLLDLIQKGYFREGANILFLHTGGTPALFPYRGEIVEHLDLA
jgi:D-cysteine desulfhydrase family pyridoxal phosphate-dependent enzyme